MAYQPRKRLSKRYMQSLAALYGDGVAPLTTRKPISSEKVPTEEMEQVRLVGWMLDRGIKHFAIPNGRASMGDNLRCMRMGQSSGVPDLCIPIPHAWYHGLFIEMKRTKGGVISPAQKEWMEYLNRVGYYAVVCKGFDEAKRTIEEYLA